MLFSNVERKEFDPRLFQKLLNTKYIGRNFVYRRETDTTMRVAKEQAIDGAPEGTLVLADYQTRGVGRVQGRSWESGECENLLFTIVFRRGNLSVDNKEPLKLSIATPIAVAYASRRVGARAWIKWPNDVWVGAKKVSGFLADNPVDGVHTVGIGINVNEKFGKEHPRVKDARSLSEAVGHHLTRERILAYVCNKLEALLLKSFAELVEEYRKYDGLAGKTVKVLPKGKESVESHEAKVLGLTEEGFLKVTTDKGEATLAAQEISIRSEDSAVYEESLVLENDFLPAISGDWVNELGSHVTFVAHRDGTLTGTYHTAVGGPTQDGVINGSWAPVDDDDGGVLIGWTVLWKAKDGTPISVATWSGRLYAPTNSEPHLKINTTWLLTSAIPREDKWQSVTTNQDTFTKEPTSRG